jgi:hypothetical protein
MTRSSVGAAQGATTNSSEKQNGNQAGITILGPLDILVLEFPGNQFKGKILHNLHELVAGGMIRILDLVVITKSQTDLVSALELSDLGGEASDALSPLRASIRQVLTNDDIYAVGEQLANNTTAAVMVFENTWAAKTKQAMLESNGRVVLFERIPHQVVRDTLADLAALGAPVA